MEDDQLIAGMYRAASGLVAWPIVLDRIVKTFDGLGLHIVGLDKPSGKIALSLHTTNSPADGIANHVLEYAASDRHVAHGDDVMVGQVINNRGHNGHMLADTPFFRDFLIPHRYRHIIGGKICDDNNLVALLAVCRGQSQRTFNIHEERRLGNLLPHFSHSVDLMRGTREWRARSDVGEALLGRSLRPSFLVGPGAKLLFTNGAGRDAFNQGSVVVNRQGVLTARDAETDAKLKCALCALGVLGPDFPQECPDRIPLWLNDVRSGHHVPACLWAIRSKTTVDTFGTETIGMLVLANDDQPRQVVPDPLVLASMFSFTPAEARVAAHLIAGAAPKQIAAALDVGMPTVRFHIRQLLSKCRCQDQRQLVRRLSEALEVNGR